MKNLHLSTLLLRLLLLLSIAATAFSRAIHDVSGHPVKPGVQYYVLPGGISIAGGLTVDSRNGSCPLNVIQAWSEVDRGLPVTFHPADPTSKTVDLDADTNVEFVGASICLQSSLVWRLEGPDASTGRYFVSTDGVVGNPGAATLSNWFRVKRSSSRSYKFVYCPTVCETCRPVCGDLGLISEDGITSWLGISDSALLLLFYKAEL